MTKYEMVGQHHQLSGQEFEQALGDGEGEGSLVCRSPRGRRIYMTDQLNNNVDSHPVIFSFLFCFNNFIYLFMAVLGLCYHLGSSLVTVYRLRVAVASPCSGVFLQSTHFRTCGLPQSRLSGSRAQVQKLWCMLATSTSYHQFKKDSAAMLAGIWRHKTNDTEDIFVCVYWLQRSKTGHPKMCLFRIRIISG